MSLMALPEQNLIPREPGAVTEIRDSQLWQPPPSYNPQETVEGHGIKLYLRLLRILWTLSRFALLIYANTRGWFKKEGESEEARLHTQGAWVRDQFIALGPTFIKIGQSLSTRVDLMPVEYNLELQKLQDEVPPFSNEEAFAIIERELGTPASEIFDRIEGTPIAAASLGQVYRASLYTGETVVIKVQRPHLPNRVNQDIAVLKKLVEWSKRFQHLHSKVDWTAVLDEFGSTVFEEMDYVEEARNAETFRASFKDWSEIYVPKIYREFSSRHVLVMEYIDGVKVTDIDGLRESGVNPPDINRLLARCYLKQLLEDGFFHADPHPGNLRVMSDGRLAFFDFGMVGRLSMELQTKIVDLFFHIVEKDVSGLITDLIKLGFLQVDSPDDPKIKPLMEALFTRYLNLKLSETQMQDLAMDLADVMYTYPFRIPAEFTYILRALMTLEGIGIIIDPDYNFFEVARPYAKEFMLKREARHFRNLIVGRLIRGEDGSIAWGKIWKLAKMALKMYFNQLSGESTPKESPVSTETSLQVQSGS